MAAKITTRLRALDLAVGSSTDEDSPIDVVERAQIYADWLDGVITLPLKYGFETAKATTDGENVVPMKPKGKLQ